MRIRTPILAVIALAAALVSGSACAAGAAAAAPAASTSPERAASSDRARRAAALLQSAKRRLADGRPEQRQFARHELEDATALDPGNSEIAVLFATVCLHADLVSDARRIASRAVGRDSTNAGAQFALGLAYRRAWLVYADDDTRDRAIVCFARGLRTSPGEFESGWAALVPLLVDEGAIEQAGDAAALALHYAASRPEAMMLAAATAQRAGDLQRADRLFQAAIPRLPAESRERFEDLAPLLTPAAARRYAALDSTQRERYVERFWAESDPDPATPLNEARLEFDARVTQALMLYGPARDQRWDMRAQYYVRFGPPSNVEFNALNLDEATTKDAWLVWRYADLGMQLWMTSHNAFLGYVEPMPSGSGGVAPFPDSLARHPELVATSYGWTVFHAIPSNLKPLDVRCALAKFRAEADTRLLAQVEVAGEPDRPFTAEWAVYDSGNVMVAHETAPMTASACRPGEAHAASFVSTLTPGRYRVGIHVDDEQGDRGVAKRSIVIPPGCGGLSLSDLVVTCGAPEVALEPGAGLRLSPETGLFPMSDDRLNVYFEIYALAPGAGGDRQFEYVCTVRPARTDRRGWLSRMISRGTGPAPIQMTRREVTQEDLRRQFLAVPVKSLPPGNYEVEVVVRNVGTGDESKAVARFVRDTASRWGAAP